LAVSLLEEFLGGDDHGSLQWFDPAGPACTYRHADAAKEWVYNLLKRRVAGKSKHKADTAVRGKPGKPPRFFQAVTA
ncbi:hypothetical protein JZU56_06155, partial [bacterium]|nr:hypothetical protein [bacterium]